MKAKDLNIVRCPFCSKKIKIKTIQKYFPDKNIRFGQAFCDCNVFDIKEGILILRKKDIKELQFFTRKAYSIVLCIQKAFQLNFYQSMRIFKLLSLKKDERLWFEYLSDRQKRATFHLQKKIVSLSSGKRIVDLCCGSGDLSNYLNKSNKIYLVDNNYWLMYLAKITGVIKNDCTCIISDLESKFPFSKQSFNSIFANDCFMYIDHQKHFLKEINRISQPKTKIAIIHIHKRNKNNLGQGNGVFPSFFDHFNKNKIIVDDKYLWKKITNPKYQLSRKVNSQNRSFSVLVNININKLKAKTVPKNKINYQEEEDWLND